MNFNTRHELVNFIAAGIKQGDVGFLVGAGISSNSDIPVVNPLLRKILHELSLNETESETLLQSNLPFESYMETLIDSSDTAALFEIFKNKVPNRNHYFLSQVSSRFNNHFILTTNFDTLIEDAFSKPDDYVKKFDLANHITSEKPMVLKIHGCITEEKKLKITLSSVASRRDSNLIQDSLENFFISATHNIILVIGYSGSDVFDINPIIENLKSDKVVLFLQYKQGATLSWELLEKVEDKNPFKKLKGLRVFVDIDSLITEISGYLNIELPPIFPIIAGWPQQVEKWGKQFDNELPKKEVLAAYLFQSIGQYIIAIDKMGKALEGYRKQGDELNFYMKLQDYGLLNLRVSNTKLAKACLEDAIKYYRKFPSLWGSLSIGINNLGGVFLSEGNFSKAIELFLEAIEFSKKFNQLELLGNRYGNLAEAYFFQDNIDRSKHYLQLALEHSKEYGNKSLEANMLLLQDKISVHLNDLHSPNLSQSASKIQFDIGNQNSELNSLIQHAEILSRKGVTEQAIAVLKSINLDLLPNKEKIFVLSKLANKYGNLGKIAEMEAVVNGLRKHLEDGIDDFLRPLIIGNIGQLCLLKKNYREALIYFNEEAKYFESQADAKNRVIAYVSMVECYLFIGDLENMKKYLEISENIAIQTNDYYHLKKILMRVGDYYNRIQDDHTALTYFERVLKFSNETGDGRVKVQALDSIAKTSYNLFDFESAKQAWLQALEEAKQHNLITEIPIIQNHLNQLERSIIFNKI